MGISDKIPCSYTLVSRQLSGKGIKCKKIRLKKRGKCCYPMIHHKDYLQYTLFYKVIKTRKAINKNVVISGDPKTAEIPREEVVFPYA